MTGPTLTSLERVLWPAAGFTKGDMLAYYEAIAPVLLPHLAGRPLTLGRFPAGVDQPGFATTQCRGRPDWVRTVAVTLRSGEVREQCVVDDLPSLLWVVNLGAIELHAFPSAHGRLEQPAFVVFDLDPGPGTGLADCCRVALWLREALADDGLIGFCKTSGGLGLHLHVPLEPGHTFDESKAFARSLAARLATERTDAVTDRRELSRRAGRVLVDWVPNSPRALIVTPYSLRAADIPAVSMPVAWHEVEAASTAHADDGMRFDAATALRRVTETGDLFRPVLDLRQRLPKTLRLREARPPRSQCQAAGKTNGMSSEERQRTIREQGSRPAEAEKAAGARTAQEVLGQQEGERQAERDHQPESETTAPLPEDDASKPRPRR